MTAALESSRRPGPKLHRQRWSRGRRRGLLQQTPLRQTIAAGRCRHDRGCRVIVLLPLAAIVWQSAGGGWQAFWQAITSNAALESFRVTLTISIGRDGGQRWSSGCWSPGC